MYQVKLFKNGNSTVMAIPEALRSLFQWKPGDLITIHPIGDYTLHHPQVICAWKPTPSPSTPTSDARKTPNKAR